MLWLMVCFCCFFFFFKQKTAYEMRISDWSSDVCSSDLQWPRGAYGAGKDRGADDRALYRDRSWICDGTAASSSRRSGLIAHILFVQTADGCAPKKTHARSKPCGGQMKNSVPRQEEVFWVARRGYRHETTDNCTEAQN